ncbi:hypothetical protein HN448_00630 [archaeon]|nr:hypothetical protein [archaeon]
MEGDTLVNLNKKSSNKKKLNFDRKKIYMYVMVVLSIVLFSTSLVLFVKEGVGSSLTSAVIKNSSGLDTNEASTKTELELNNDLSSESETVISDSFNQDEENSINYFDEQRVEFSLDLNQVINIDAEINSENVLIIFDGNGEELIINGELVEFGEMADVELELENFNGHIDLNNFAVSLNGYVDKVFLNEFSISSSNNIEIYFERAHDNYVQILGFSIEQLTLPAGSGGLQASDKLTYELDEETVTIGDFEGDLVVIKKEETSSLLIGKSNSLSLDGDLLAFDLW